MHGPDLGVRGFFLFLGELKSFKQPLCHPLERLAVAELVVIAENGSRRVRERYRAACAARRSRLDQALRRSGAEPLWLRSDQSPLYALGRFFQERATRRGRVAA